MEFELIKSESLDVMQVFSSESGIDKILKDIEQKVLSHVPDIETPSGRKNIASLAYKVSQSKTLLDNMGKNLVADWKQKAKLVDDSRKKAREFLDDLKTKARQPLTDWEQAEAEKEAARKLAEEIESAYDDAARENELFDARKEIARLAAIEAERLAKEKAIEQERLAKKAAEDREKRLIQEAEARLKREIEIEKILKERAIEEKAAAQKAAEEREKRLVQEAEEKAARKLAEAEMKARIEKENELRIKAEADAAERKRQENAAHRNNVKRQAKESFMAALDCSEPYARDIVLAIDGGLIKNVVMVY